MTDLFLSLGSNQGNRKELLQKAVRLIENEIGHICTLSHFYETAPWGFESDHMFLNAAAHIQTDKNPTEILLCTQSIEKLLGRTTKSSNGVYHDRTIDIDILFYGDLCMDKNIIDPYGQPKRLTLPHPLLHLRDFVLKPMVEIAPTFIHPQLQVSICTLWQLQQSSMQTGNVK